MTAEVAVLNKSAVALAADSAMSVGDTGKTYPTNKLFALTKHHPVGIMVYNNANFMGVPWETIVKMYRDELGAAHRPTVKDYAEDFLGYVGNDTICTPNQCERNFQRLAAAVFRPIAHEVSERVGNGQTVAAIIRELVDAHSTALAAVGQASSMQGIDAIRMVQDHEDAINEVANHFFRDHRVGDSDRQLLHNVFAVFATSSHMSAGHSGLVFAGFGNDEIFPSLVEVATDGAIDGIIKTDTRKTIDLDRTGTQTAIVPFAQSEMVGRFMEGVDTSFFRYMESHIEALLTDVTREIIDSSTAHRPLTDDQLALVRSVAEDGLNRFRHDTEVWRREHFVNPVLDIVKHLPKEELANMAEALVSLTSIKRRVSMEEESVGGPIDVAVVSKGDGFIWIKRKHYFDPSLNRDYLVRHSPLRFGAQGA